MNYGQEKQGNTRRFWRRFQGVDGCATDKGVVHCEETFEVTEGEEGVIGGGGRGEMMKGGKNDCFATRSI